MPTGPLTGRGGPQRPSPGLTFVRFGRGWCAKAACPRDEHGHVPLWRVAYAEKAFRVLFQFHDLSIYDFWPVTPLEWYTLNPHLNYPGYFYNFFVAPALLDGTKVYRRWWHPNYPESLDWWWPAQKRPPRWGDLWEAALRVFRMLYGETNEFVCPTEQARPTR